MASGSTPERTPPASRRGSSATAGPARIVQAGELRSARIESVRALAALGVLLGHVYGSAHAYRPQEIYGTFLERTLLGGGFGVFLFFVLSGYLLFWPFARRDFAGGGAIDLRRYAINRALRILPLYYVVIVVVLAVQENGAGPGVWARFLLWAESFSTQTVAKVDGVVWSLVVELHFYILLPLLALGLGRLARGSRARAVALLVGAGALSFLWRQVTLSLDPTPSPLWRYSLPDTFFFFVFGMLLALLRLSWEERRPRWLRGPLASSDCWLLASIPLWALVFWRYKLDVVAGAASFLIVGACVLPLRPGRLLRALEWRWLAALGIASYSLYLWHVPILGALTGGAAPSYGYAGLLAIAVPLCCAVALVSYALVEAPFLRLRRRWAAGTAPEIPGPGQGREARRAAEPAPL